MPILARTSNRHLWTGYDIESRLQLSVFIFVPAVDDFRVGLRRGVIAFSRTHSNSYARNRHHFNSRGCRGHSCADDCSHSHPRTHAICDANGRSQSSSGAPAHSHTHADTDTESHPNPRTNAGIRAHPTAHIRAHGHITTPAYINP